MSKARLTKVATLARKYANKHGGTSWQRNIDRWLEARSRGMYLGKDGVERTQDEWLKTLNPKLREQLSGLLEQEEK